MFMSLTLQAKEVCIRFVGSYVTEPVFFLDSVNNTKHTKREKTLALFLVQPD